MNSKMKLASDTQHGNADHTNNNDYLTELIRVEETPFTIVRQDKSYYVMMGRYRLNENVYTTEEDARKDAERDDWDRRLQVMSIVAMNITEDKQLLNNYGHE